MSNAKPLGKPAVNYIGRSVKLLRGDGLKFKAGEWGVVTEQVGDTLIVYLGTEVCVPHVFYGQIIRQHVRSLVFKTSDVELHPL